MSDPSAQAATEPSGSNDNPWPFLDHCEPEGTGRIIVKFSERGRLPYSDDVHKAVRDDHPEFYNWLAQQFPDFQIRPLFTFASSEKIARLMDQAKSAGDPTYEDHDFLTYFQIIIADFSGLVRFAATAVSVLPTPPAAAPIDDLYLEDRPGGLPNEEGTPNPERELQVYLNPASQGGIDAQYAHGQSGGKGEGQRIIDLEQGWNLCHEDLVGRRFELLAGKNLRGSANHGTKVLGVIAAQDNLRGCLGIVPGIASIGLVSQVRSETSIDVTGALMQAVANSRYGDVLLLEVQGQTPDGMYTEVPIEALEVRFRIIRLAAALGVTVVEAAGNAGKNLDHIRWRRVAIFDRSERDSLAVLVAAATPPPHLNVLAASCYGSRIDCFALGASVRTCFTNDAATVTDRYTSNFGETSAASAIIAGAAAAIQGVAQSKSGKRLPPRELRNLLANDKLNTSSADEIGVMPDLKAILTSSEFAEALRRSGRNGKASTHFAAAR